MQSEVIILIQGNEARTRLISGKVIPQWPTSDKRARTATVRGLCCLVLGLVGRPCPKTDCRKTTAQTQMESCALFGELPGGQSACKRMLQTIRQGFGTGIEVFASHQRVIRESETCLKAQRIVYLLAGIWPQVNLEGPQP